MDKLFKPSLEELQQYGEKLSQLFYKLGFGKKKMLENKLMPSAYWKHSIRPQSFRHIFQDDRIDAGKICETFCGNAPPSGERNGNLKRRPQI